MTQKKSISLKTLIVGDSGVGKTSLLVRYCENTFQTDFLSTIGVDFKIKRTELQDYEVTLNIWDTAGQQRFKNITKSFYKGAHGVILTYSITDPQSFAHIQSWMNQIREVGNTQLNMILVASKSDMQKDRRVTKKQGELLSQKYNIKFVETSSKNNENIDRIFQDLALKIIQRFGEQDKLKDMIQNHQTHLYKKRQQVKQKYKNCC